jgi:hypothetical protein
LNENKYEEQSSFSRHTQIREYWKVVLAWKHAFLYHQRIHSEKEDGKSNPSIGLPFTSSLEKDRVTKRKN